MEPLSAMGFVLVTFTLATAVALAACSGSDHATLSRTAESSRTIATEPSPTVIPFTPVPVNTPARLGAIANVRACVPRDLKGVLIREGAATGGEKFVGTLIRDLSASPCRLAMPIIEMIGPSGNVLRTVPEGADHDPTCDTPPGGAPFCISAQPVLLLSQQTQFPPTEVTPGLARFSFSYDSEGPGGGSCSAPDIATVVRFVLPGDVGSIDVPTGPEFAWGLVVCNGSMRITWFAAS